jgi:hypothetical protein
MGEGGVLFESRVSLGICEMGFGDASLAIVGCTRYIAEGLGVKSPGVWSSTVELN